jgi:hypothetical protein
MPSTILDLNELTAPAYNDFMLVRDISDASDRDKKMQLQRMVLKSGTPVAGHIAAWVDAYSLQDAGYSVTGGGTLALGGYTLTVPATGTAALKTGTPVLNNLAAWNDANTVKDGGFALTDISRLSQVQSFSALKTFSAGLNLGQTANLGYYDEGTWTPALKFGGASVGMTTNAVGQYTRVGNVVHAWGAIRPTVLGSSTGAVTVTGLPFTAANIGILYFAIALFSAAVTRTGILIAQLGPGQSTIVFQVDNNGAVSALQNTGISTTSELYFEATYRV